MRDDIHVVPGLPRSGSTLVPALLRQSLRFHAFVPSPLNSLVNAPMRDMRRGHECGMFIPAQRRRRAELTALRTARRWTDGPPCHPC